MSTFVARPPRPPLDRWIEAVWWYACDASSGVEIGLPTGRTQLLINLEDGVLHGDAGELVPIRGPLLHGPWSRPVRLLRRDQRVIVGVKFAPFGLRRFLGVPIHELHDRDVALDDLWAPPDVRRLHDRLVTAPSPARCLDVLEAELLAVAATPRPVDRRVLVALDQLERRSVGEVARELGLSARRFTTLFQETVGTTPKLWARLQRFQRALPLILADVDLAAVALRCGYADQPHLNRDFRAFAGVSPTVYRRLGPEHANHLPADVAFVQDPTRPA